MSALPGEGATPPTPLQLDGGGSCGLTPPLKSCQSRGVCWSFRTAWGLRSCAVLASGRGGHLTGAGPL
eukprot:scaffold1197_cov121-Isochrysis_galbana.AAC.5